jgi:hypothetical protein
MKAVKNLQSYQNEMRAWRDKKVKRKGIKARDLVVTPHVTKTLTNLVKP